MIAIYPGVDGDVITQTRLLSAYVRRKRFEARLLALEVGKLFGGAQDDRVSADELLSMMGIQPVIADGS